MAERTSIEWCDHTANIWWGCTDVHAGCDNCYARTIARAKGKGDGWEGVRYATVGIWKELPKWQAAAKAAGVQRRVFCGSMMDIFEKSQPVCDWKGNPIPGVETGQLRDRYLREIIPATPDLMHLLLTKRPSNILKMVPAEWLEPGGWPRNVMTGTSPVDQPTADILIPQLLRVPGTHFLSMEPLLGPVDLTGMACRPLWPASEPRIPSIDWVIVGGESGPNARPMAHAWAGSLKDQCENADVPFFFKQWGEYAPVETEYSPSEGHIVTAIEGELPDDRRYKITKLHDEEFVKIGKNAAGRHLDGVTHDGFPEFSA